MAKKIFVTGIGTDVGKTFCAAILVEALKADYWKPVQAGELGDLDSLWVRDHISNKKSRFHKERYLLSSAMSPHAAAKLDGIQISLDDFTVPETDNVLIIEGAGGLMVPLNEQGDLVIDLIPRVSDETILVATNYLGSINHTLLTVALLRARKINLKGIIFNGESNAESEEFILKYTGVPCLSKIPSCEQELKEFIRDQAEQLLSKL
jgi:dethiobiotin synthetase